MSAPAILYSSLAGHTKTIAARIAAQARIDAAHVYAVKTMEPAHFAQHPVWIVCFPTYGMGEIDHQMKKFLSRCTAEMLTARRVALVALGDQKFHGKTFAESLCAVREQLIALGATADADWPTDDYVYESSRAINAQGNFHGLVLDEINQPDLTDARVAAWLQRHQLHAGGVA